MSERTGRPAPARTPLPPERTRRRSPEQVRGLLLEAAAELFAAQGYTRTGTRAIAERAGVAEVLLFRHFGSKANLFREAIHAPVVAAIEEFVADWSVTPGTAEPDLPVHDFVEKLHAVLDGRRGAMLALTGIRAYTEEVQRELAGHEEPMAALFEELERVVLRYAAASGFTGLNPPLSSRTAVGMVLGMSSFRDWLQPADDEWSPDGVVDELAALLLHGTRHRPAT